MCVKKLTMARTRRTSEEMGRLLEAFRDSGQTMKAFCARQGVPLSVFSYWQRKLRGEVRSSGGFVEITPASARDTGYPVAEVIYPSGIRLRFYSPMSPSYLMALVAREG